MHEGPIPAGLGCGNRLVMTRRLPYPEENIMARPFVTARAATVFAAIVLLSAAAAPVRAQGGYTPPKRLELTPFGSYQWGGSFDTQGISNILAGEINEQGSFS